MLMQSTEWRKLLSVTLCHFS